MTRARKIMLVVVVTAAVGVGAFAIRAATGTGSDGVPGSARLAVALVPGSGGSLLVVVDADNGRIVRRIGLRSLVTDMDADTARGIVVAAQTGGVGTAADNAVSFTDPRTGAVSYVTLPMIDPSQVRCVAGRAVVMHAVVDARGFVLSSLDLASRSVVATGHAPDGTGLWAAAGGALWTASPTGTPPALAATRIDPVTLYPTRLPALGFAPAGVTGAGDAVVVLGASADASGSGVVALLDSRSGAPRARAIVPGLAHGAQIAAAVGPWLVVGDWNGGLPESGVLAVLDATTLAPRRRLVVGSAPCALAAVGGDVLVVDRAEGALRRVDPASGDVRWRVDLGARDLVCSRVVVLSPRGGDRDVPAAPVPPTGTVVAER